MTNLLPWLLGLLLFCTSAATAGPPWDDLPAVNPAADD